LEMTGFVVLESMVCVGVESFSIDNAKALSALPLLSLSVLEARKGPQKEHHRTLIPFHLIDKRLSTSSSP
jgi:hypothetical protein